MGSPLFTNRAATTLASGIANSDLSLSVTPGTGALFPNPAGGDYFYITLRDSLGNEEIVKVTERSTDSFTILRAQDGTTAKSFAIPTTVELRINAKAITDITDSISTLTASLGDLAFLDADPASTTHIARTDNPHAVTAAQVGAVPSSYLDTDTSLAANSDTKIPSQKAVKTYVDSAIGTIPPTGPWTSAGTFTRTADSTFTVTNNATNQDTFRLGRPIRYRATAGTWRYGLVTDYSSGTVTVSGAPLTTSDDDEMQYGDMSRVVQETFSFNGYFADGADSALIEHDLLARYVWKRGQAYCVHFAVRPLVDDSGAAQPRVNVLISPKNLLTYSEQFDNAAWTKTRATVSANAAVAPDGTTTADKLVEDTTAGASHYTYRTFTPVAGTTYVLKAFAKADSRSAIRLSGEGGGSATVNMDFNLSTGSVISGTSGGIASVGGGWYVCWVVFTATTTATAYFDIVLHSGSTVSYTGDGTSGLYIWGAQLEAGSFPTSYQPRVAETMFPVSTSNSNAGLAVNDAAWVATGVDISATNYGITYGQALEVAVDANGTNDNAQNLTALAVFVLE